MSGSTEATIVCGPIATARRISEPSFSMTSIMASKPSSAGSAAEFRLCSLAQGHAAAKQKPTHYNFWSRVYHSDYVMVDRHRGTRLAAAQCRPSGCSPQNYVTPDWDSDSPNKSRAFPVHGPIADHAIGC